MNTQILAGCTLIIGLVLIHPAWIVPIVTTIIGALIITLGFVDKLLKRDARQQKEKNYK